MIEAPMDSLTKEAVQGQRRQRSRRPSLQELLRPRACSAGSSPDPWSQPSIGSNHKFAKKPEVAAANIAAFKAGWNFGDTTEAAKTTFEVRPAVLPPGVYTNVTGNTALAWGLIAAAQCAKLPLVLRHLSDHPCLRHPP